MINVKLDYNKLNIETKKNIMAIAQRNSNCVVIVDMSYHLYRFYYTFKNLSINNNGVIIPTGHIYGFLNMICRLRRLLDKPAIILAVDGRDQERKKINYEYKLDRSSGREYNVHGTTNDILSMLGLLEGVYKSYHPDYEADDTIYSVARALDFLFTKNKIDKDIYIYGNDRDLYQAIGGKVKVVKNFGKTKNKVITGADIVDYDRVFNEYEVYPENLAIYKALTGDSSDGLRGYYRFPKKFAAYLANNCTISEDGMVVYEDELNPSQVKHYNDVKNNYTLFWKNYCVIRPKNYLFEIVKPDSGNAHKLITFYSMNSYRKEVGELG